MNLLIQIRSLFEPALASLVAEPAKVVDYLAAIKPAANADHGDYQANMAMAMAKTLGQKPQDVARAIIAALPENAILETPTVAGPGFINLRIKSDFLATALRGIATTPKFGVEPAKPRTFVIDLSGPNVAKPLHVGHLRSTIIGDSLVRILRFLGHTVIGDNHLGDWGLQFGILIYGYKHHLDAAAFQDDPVRELARLYVTIRKQFRKVDDDEEGPTDDPLKKACQEETAKLHAGDPENVSLWKQFMPACLKMLEPIYNRLGVKIDHAHGESFYNDMLPGVVEDMLAKGIASESKGAIVIPNARGVVPRTEEEQKKEEPPAIIRKRDGAFTYTTTDLATIKYRMETWKPDAMLYVVSSPQALHFKTIFAQARRWGYPEVEYQHIQFGSMLDPATKKKLSTSGGNSPELEPLLDDAVRLSLQKYEASVADRREHGHKVYEATNTEKQMIAEVVGVGAVKYADLCQNRATDYVFDLDKMTETVGNTAAYMQYAYARCRSIFREGEIDDTPFRTNPPAVQITHTAERALALQLLRFPEAVENAAADYLPHLITVYLWDLAKSYSVFFDNCPVLKAPTTESKESRLLLVDLASRVIRQTLDLLGIQTVERM